MAARDRDDECAPDAPGWSGAQAQASPEPTPLASVPDTIDESSLLAETEDLLDTLDPSAFARSSSSSSSREDALPVAPVSAAAAPATRSRRDHETKDESLTTSSATTAAAQQPPAPPPPVRDKRKEEMQQLRSEAAALEAQLAQLRHQRHSALRVRDKRQQIWQELVARQCRLRQLAERENQQLKALLQNMLRISDPGQIERSLGLPAIPGRVLEDRLPNYLHGSWYKALPAPPQDAELAAIFEPMLRRLDVGFAEIDAVFSENGLHQELMEPRSYAERKARRLGQPCHFIELVDVRFLPFHWLAVGNTTWELNRSRNLSLGNSHVYTCAERPEDSLAVCFRKQHATGGQQGRQQSMECRLVMRRYTQSHRVVLICANQTEGEDELAGAHTSDIGYLSISNASRLADPGGAASPVTVIRACMQVFSSQTDQSEARLDALLNLMVSAYEEDVRFVRQAVDSALLQQQAALASSETRASISVVHEDEGEDDNGEERKGKEPRITFKREDLTRHHR